MAGTTTSKDDLPTVAQLRQTNKRTRASDSHDLNDTDTSSPSKRTRTMKPVPSAQSSTTDSVGSLTPSDDDVHLDLPEYVPNELIPRIRQLRLFTEPELNRYSIACIPSEARWGTGVHSQHLCLNDKPVVVWMVGVLRWNRLMDNVKWNIGLKFLCDDDNNAARRLRSVYSQPPYDTSNDGSLTFVNKWINASDKSVQHSFEHVYDAVDSKLQGWDPSRRVPASRLQGSDVVVVECYVKRFKPKTPGSPQKGWVSWAVTFELLRIAQLLVGPGIVDEPPPDSNASI
ncbi:hypothetical protein C8Q70DRAFT_1055607 [Cubamyces menziesii]|uniref:Uncharacterized protein n=1 Tax=Trametes cubensis TaxID=1111947 RepID=A0AAD7TLF2_9APHY|nr:hypothetical protein C8Q70DRAFT_1055607 [Cubamyces menziesii]KAJ8468780.1 hypothetical protein ONZ51_g9418 [Trametes cubensis]